MNNGSLKKTADAGSTRRKSEGRFDMRTIVKRFISILISAAIVSGIAPLFFVLTLSQRNI